MRIGAGGIKNLYPSRKIDVTLKAGFLKDEGVNTSRRR